MHDELRAVAFYYSGCPLGTKYMRQVSSNLRISEVLSGIFGHEPE